MKELGLYIHIPFCRSKCKYCDFCSFPNRTEADFEAYVEALCLDLRARAADCRDYLVDTVYFGGGTPTVLSWWLLEKILKTVFDCYRVAENAEITSECNPKTGDARLFREMRKMGFNRLSIGLQSTHGRELRTLGRIHSFADFGQSFRDARAAGFENINADLMSGIPHQTSESYLESIDRLCDFAPEHISAYSLIVEEGTPFGDMGGRLLLPSEDVEEEMYFRGAERLLAHGYRQYEISNFAKEGYESRHNLRYWDCKEFLGFGPAAYSDFGGERFGNSRDVDAYIRGESILTDRERPTRNQRMNEYVMLRMRLAAGVDYAEFERHFGRRFEDCFGDGLRRYRESDLLTFSEGRVAFTPKGMRVSNAILSELLDFGE